MRKTRNKQIYEEASEWLVDLRVGDMDAAAHERLDAWLRESPHHIRAFLEVSATWEDAERPDLDRRNTTADLVAHARASMNVIALEGLEHPAQRQDASSSHRVSHVPSVGSVKRSRFRFWPSGILAAATLACLGFLIVAIKSYWGSVYATGTGEQRIVHLTDGSIIELNSKSRIRVRFSERERGVELIDGEALFKVAKDLARPFVVQSSGARVRAVGTQFDVYKKPNATQVTVVEGRVAIFSSATPNTAVAGQLPSAPPGAEKRLMEPRTTGGSVGETPDVLVSAGEQVTVGTHSVSQPRPADLRAATAWTQQELVFDMAPLAEVVQEFNRYNTQKLVVSDLALAEFHVTGVFSSTDPASLLRFLRSQPSIEVTEVRGEIVISKQ